jgi:hypothetical protein
MPRESASPKERRVRLRDQFWPDADEWIWDPDDKAVKGYARMTRMMPLVLRLIRECAKKPGDPSMVYLELWTRDFGQGIVENDEPDVCAFAAGYKGKRATRTWQAHMKELVDMGFIMAAKVGSREFGQVLLLDPLAVCARYQDEGKMPDGLWNAIVAQAHEVSAKLPPAKKVAGAYRPKNAASKPDSDD